MAISDEATAGHMDKKQQAWQESKETVDNSNGEDLCYASLLQHSLVFFDLHMTLGPRVQCCGTDH